MTLQKSIKFAPFFLTGLAVFKLNHFVRIPAGGESNSYPAHGVIDIFIHCNKRALRRYKMETTKLAKIIE